MKKKFFLFLILAGCVNIAATAQITTGANTAKVIRTGNRATQGDFGLYFGVSSDIVRHAFNQSYEIDRLLPLVNLKYMATNDVELRLGLEFNKYSQNVAGTVEATDAKTLYKYVTSQNMIYPGFAYHFSRLNILDVYAGAELPLGYGRYKAVNEAEVGENYHNVTRTSFNVGLGGFIGLQAYIADLPLAVGLEYGIASMFDLNNKYKHEIRTPGNSEEVIYTDDATGMGTQYSELGTSRTGEIGSQFRFTITYFFK